MYVKDYASVIQVLWFIMIALVYMNNIKFVICVDSRGVSEEK